MHGYTDTENMWEQLLNLEKCATCPSRWQKFTKDRNGYTPQANDRRFKVEKNPHQEGAGKVRGEEVGEDHGS